MISAITRWEIIKYKRKGFSDKRTADNLGIDRRTVKQYWNEHKKAQKDTKVESDPQKIAKLQEILVGGKVRKGTGSKTACTPEAYARVWQILDELGYVSFKKDESEILFNLISSRYSKGSMIITTNLTFDRWNEVFGDNMVTSAMVDRLAFKAHILDMTLDTSYRYEKTIAWSSKKKKR